jgi:ribonuclease-3
MAACYTASGDGPRGARLTAFTLPDTPDAAGVSLAALLGYDFARPELLTEALTHRSALRPLQQGRRRQRRAAAAPRNYERLEFLGDRVLGLVVADLLWRRFEHEAEGHLTQRLTHLVRFETLARVAAGIGLDRHLSLSPAEAAAGAARNPAILADAMEAVIAAVYLDGGFAAAFALIERLWRPVIEAMEATPPRDAKTMLQEWVQGRGLPLPAYRLEATAGPDHAPQFTVAVHVAGQDDASGTAPSKRAAETAAAAAFLQRLNATDNRAEKDGKSAAE